MCWPCFNINPIMASICPHIILCIGQCWQWARINHHVKVYCHSICHLCPNMIQQPPCKCWDFLCQMRWPHNGSTPMLILLQLGPCFLPHSMSTSQGVPPRIKYLTPLAHYTEQSFPPLTHSIEQSFPPLAHFTEQSFPPLAHSIEQSLPLIKVKLYSSTLTFHCAYVISLCHFHYNLMDNKSTKNSPTCYLKCIHV
jgi:hypothetical protein